MPAGSGLAELVELLGTLREALLRELDQLLGERELLVRIAAPAQGLLDRAASRASFQRKSQTVQLTLLEKLRTACAAAGLPEPSISALAKSLGGAADELRARYAEVTALAKQYAQEEEISRQILQRTLLCVKAYVAALSPKPAYDRRGYTTQARLSTISTRI